MRRSAACFPANIPSARSSNPTGRIVTALNQNVTLGCDNQTGIDFYNDPLVCISGTKFNNCTKAGSGRLDDISQRLDRSYCRPECHSQRRQLAGLQPASRSLYRQRDPATRLEESLLALNQNVTLGCDNQTGIDFYNDPLVCLSGTKFNNCTKARLRRLDDISQRLDRSYCRPECHSQRRQMAGLQPPARSLYGKRDPATRLDRM